MKMAVPIKAHRYTVSEYLQLERTSLEKHEYRDGEIIAMAGGTYRHSLIIANLVGELRNALKGTPCRALESNLRVRIPRSPLFIYPDATVICGQPQFDPGDDNQETLIHPRVILEVLSPSTEAYDRGENSPAIARLKPFRNTCSSVRTCRASFVPAPARRHMALQRGLKSGFQSPPRQPRC